MKALFLEYLYEKKTIAMLFISTFAIYILYLFIFKEPELILSFLTISSTANTYGTLISKRKSTNFERFLAVSPLGKKKIVDTIYIINLIFAFLIVGIFFLLYAFRTNYFNKVYGYGCAIGYLGIEIKNTPLNFLIILCNGILSGGILSPLYILSNKDEKKITSIVYLLFIIFFGLIVYFLYSVNIFTLNIRILLYFILSIILYIVSYCLTLKLYATKDL